MKKISQAGMLALIYFAVQNALVLVLYFGVGKYCQVFAFLDSDVTLAWLPSGIALAALLLFGYRLWPGIALGAFSFALYHDALVAPAASIMVGDTVESLLGAFLLKRVVKLDYGFERMRDVLGFAGLGVLFATAVGTALILLGFGAAGTASWHDYWSNWWMNWLGHAIGVMMVAPAILIWTARPRLGFNPEQKAEAALLLAVTFCLSAIVFSDMPSRFMANPVQYAVFPPLMWAALRFSQREMVTLLLVCSALAVWGTTHGFGPFMGGSVDQNLISLYLFLNVLWLVSMLLSASMRERKLAEDKLRKREESYRLLVENQTELILKLDTHGRVMFASPSYCDAFAATEEKLIGKHPNPEVSEEDREIARLARAKLFHAPHNCGYEQRVMTRDGWRWLAWSEKAVLDDAGAVVSTVAVGRDITERKRAEEQSRQHLQQLAHVTRLSSMGEMATAIAHEINQPLTSILSYAQACLRLLQSGSADKEEIKGAMQRVAAQAERAGDIVRHLRNFLRKDEGRAVTVDINYIVSEVLRLAQTDARQSGVAMKVQLADNLPAAVVDNIQIQQVILNLLRNGIDAINAGRGETREITVFTSLTGNGEIEVAVRDSGHGLDDELREKIFEAFFTTKPDGMGIGLSISRSIVESHGGRLSVESQPGGTTFRFTLPTARSPGT